MKTTLLAAALASTLALGACAKSPPADDTAMDTATPDAAMTTDQPDTVAPDTTMPAADTTAVGGASMDASKDIIDNATASPAHTTLVAAVKAADLVDTLKGAGPFTVFAPTNDAFDALPAGTVDNLLKPEMKDDLSKVLTYHVVAGNVDAAALTGLIQAGGGSAKLATVQGGELVARADGGVVTITDAKGNAATVTTADLRQSNGVIHVVDKVLMP